MLAIGITCGIGSMLVGARQAGFDIVGNVEWRRYYHAVDHMGRNTFRENFREAIFKHKITDLTPEEIERIMNPTLALGHPECGNFSQLGGVNKGRLGKLADPADIPLFIEMVARLKPRYFVMDDLPKSFGAFPMSRYMEMLPDYDLFPEWVSNWGYGNVQKHRNRMFMIGSLREERWTFVPGEAHHNLHLADVIGDLPEPRVGSNFPNHDPAALGELAQKNLSMRFIGDRPTWAEVRDYAREHWREGQSMTYFANDGQVKYKPGCKIEHWGGENHGSTEGRVTVRIGHKVEHWQSRGASVQDGGSYKLHPVRFTPLTIRERARIQGFPDDFVFYGTKLNEEGEYNPDKNLIVTKQTGKAMPIQFCRFVSEQVADAVRGNPRDPRAGTRILQPNPDVDAAKFWFCENRGYADQPSACGACWLYSRCTIRSRKYRIGEPTGEAQRDLIDPGLVPSPDLAASRQRRRPEKPTEVVRATTPPEPDTSDIPEVGKEFFERARLVRPSRFGEAPESYDLEFGS